MASCRWHQFPQKRPQTQYLRSSTPVLIRLVIAELGRSPPPQPFFEHQLYTYRVPTEHLLSTF